MCCEDNGEDNTTPLTRERSWAFENMYRICIDCVDPDGEEGWTSVAMQVNVEGFGTFVVAPLETIIITGSESESDLTYRISYEGSTSRWEEMMSDNCSFQLHESPDDCIYATSTRRNPEENVKIEVWQTSRGHTHPPRERETTVGRPMANDMGTEDVEGSPIGCEDDGEQTSCNHTPTPHERETTDMNWRFVNDTPQGGQIRIAEYQVIRVYPGETTLIPHTHKICTR